MVTMDNRAAANSPTTYGVLAMEDLVPVAWRARFARGAALPP
jgi:hypothetical protein